ncbi:MAG: alcohol dehydrogenase catalytic domain-containing protein [Anaerolineales bacterium]|nr:alcohol dehydrogenase catalytic domain-containing protein [Anaerolineales bacterium]
MRALWLEKQQLQFRKDVALPVTKSGDVLIRTKLAGICSTDLELVNGYYPFIGIPGHEFVGEVVEAPGFPDLMGKRVVGEINIVCGHCPHCLQGRSSHCVNRKVLGIAGRNGVFADYFTLPAENLHILPNSISDEQAVFTEPIAAALEIQEQIRINPADRVLVVGAGRLGQLVAQTLSLTGCDLSVVARYAKQRRLLENRRINVLDEDNIPQGEMDIVVDTTGSPAGYLAARFAVRSRGTLVMKSTYAGTLELNASALVVDEITVIGSRCGPIAPAIKLLKDHLVDPVLLIEESFSINDSIRAIQRAGERGALKILLTY